MVQIVTPRTTIIDPDRCQCDRSTVSHVTVCNVDRRLGNGIESTHLSTAERACTPKYRQIFAQMVRAARVDSEGNAILHKPAQCHLVSSLAATCGTDTLTLVHQAWREELVGTTERRPRLQCNVTATMLLSEDGVRLTKGE